ncbi:formylglycine-generating enzyme family protein [Ekhidna sp.]|uniref:formylglycine-generating enzyme family protein n=1 Tax=Ekhidna sp. TaxID=2608089 RepID=UPI003B5048D8
MKILLTVLIAFVCNQPNRPSDIPSKITELKTNAWYSEKAEEWKNYIASDASDEQSWLQYFLATSYAGKDIEIIQSIRNQILEKFPNSFTEYYTKFRLVGWNNEGVKALESALNIDDSQLVSFEDQLVYADLTGAKNRAVYSKKLFEAGLIHSSTLNYNYNLLMSVSDEGLLITDGLHTTIPIWVLQDVMNIRKDVSILNLELARNQPKYLERVLQENDLSGTLEELLGEAQGQNIYYALTLPRTSLQKLENRLYVVGLASTVGTSNFNHFETLQKNIEEKFLMDYLTIDFNGEPKTATGNVLSSNYIVSLMLLKDFYDQLNDEERSTELKDQILSLAEKSQIRTRVELLLDAKKSPQTFKVVDFDIKTLDKRMQPIKEGIYASEIELSNREFWFYMEYLRVNGYEELYEKGLVDLSEYDEVTRALLSSYHYSPANAQMEEKKRPGGSYFDYPVMDISFEVAKDYCEWLTVQYNAHPKRKYQKVRFRLPSQQEWTMAALSYVQFTSWNIEENKLEAWSKETDEKSIYNLSKETVSYPWYYEWGMRNQITNEKGCYLANVKVPEEVTCAAGIKGDGYTFTSPVGTYFSNNFSLYDVVGNVAEMTDTEGIAMGGSWRHLPEDCTVTSINTYEGRDLSVGMRLFMEVIEE